MNAKKTVRETFIQQNLGLVHACVRRFTHKGIEYDELFSAGCMGIVKAFNAFDKTKNVKFSTYAVPVILGEIKRLFRDSGSVKISRSIKELAIKIKKKTRANFNRNWPRAHSERNGCSFKRQRRANI